MTRNDSPTGLNKTRSLEWLFTCLLFAWGVNMLRPDEFFDAPVYTLMDQVMTETRWGLITISVAIIRAVGLGINGWWRRTPLLRLFGSLSGGLCWLSIWFLMLVASYTLHAKLPAGFTWYPFFILFEGWCVAAAGYDIFRNGSLSKRVPVHHVG